MIMKQNIYSFILTVILIINKGNSICDYPSCEPCDIVWENVCYKYFANNEYWTQARDSCIAWGGHLVSLSSQQELDIVSSLYNGIPAWTSLNNIGVANGSFSWGDTTPITSIVQPTSSAQEQCGSVLAGSPNTLEMATCEQYRYYVCSRTVACGENTLFIDGRCFDLYNNYVTRHQASAACEVDGSYLASVLSVEEERLLNIVVNFTADSYWIGLINQSSAVTWLDGNDVTYTNSLLPQSDTRNGTLECVYVASVNNVVEWRHGDCNSEYYRYMCTVGAVQIPPLALRYSILSSTTVKLFWNEIPLEYRHSPITQYTLTYDAIGFEQASGVVNLGGSTVEYVNEALQPNVQYLFSLSADTRVNTSPKATLLGSTYEEVNEDISTVFVDGDSAFISWQPFGNQYQYTNSYSILILQTSPNTTTIVDDVTNINAYHINKLTPSTQYSITVKNTRLDPQRTRHHYFTTTPGEIVHPLYLVLTNLNSTSIDVSWSSPPLDTGDTITQFSLIYSSLEIDDEDRNVVLAADVLSYTIADLEEYITYSVTVMSYTELKGKTGESIGEITTLESAPVGMPRDLAATPITASILLITWLAPVYTEINGKLTDFTLIYSSTKDNGPKDVEKVIPVTEGTNNYYFILQGLSYGGPDFNLSLAANNAVGRGPVASIAAPTLHSGSSEPRQLNTTNVTSNSIEVAWNSPEEEEIDGIAEMYTLTYQGYPLDNSLHEMQFPYTNAGLQVAAILENLEEDTTYTIQVFLTASGIISQPATLVVQTEDAAPSAPVQNLTTRNASPFAVLVSWEPIPLQHVNGEVLFYNITTQYTDPANTNITDLEANFTRINITDRELILLRNLWYEVNFTVTVTPYTLNGYGPPASTTFYLIPESAPVVVNPERDEFLAGKTALKLVRNITCEASGNPTPLIQWYRRNGTLIKPEYNPDDPYTLVITEEDLTAESTEYVCIATNRNGEYMREVFITVIGESVSSDVLNDTLNLVEEQDTISGGQAVNVLALVDVGLDGTPNITDNSTNSTNISSNANVLLASEILPPVTTRLEEDTLDTSSSKDIFRVNAKAIEVSLEIQNPVTRFNPEVNGCEYLEAFYDTERSTANSIVALEALVPKIVYTNERENITNFTITGERNSFIEAVNLNMSSANASETVTFPYLSENISRERVVVPSELFVNNNSNFSQIYSLVTTAIIKSNNTNNSVISISITQRSENSTYVVNQLTKEVTLFFPSEPAPVGKKFVCLFLNSSLGKWSGDGVRFIEFDEKTRTVECVTNHLSSFSILIETKEEEKSEIERILLSTLSYTLLSISFLSLLATIVIFMRGGRDFISIKGGNGVNILFLNQILALLFATSLFLFGIETAAKINPIMCTTVAVLLQYSWTAVMSWSLCIAIYIFLRTFRDASPGRMLMALIPLGWVFPVPFVILSLGASQWSNYVSEDTEECYTSTDGWLIWIFLGPVYFIVIVNVFVFISIMFLLLRIRIQGRKHQKGNDLSTLKVIVSKAIVSSFLLGLPWIVASVKLLTHILDNGESSISIIDKVINWSFIILNSPIGLAWLIIIAISYKDCKAKQQKKQEYPSTQKTRDETDNWNTMSRSRPVPKSKSHKAVKDKEMGPVDDSLLDSSVHSNTHSDFTSPQTKTALSMKTSNSSHIFQKPSDSFRMTERVPYSTSLDNMEKIFTKSRPRSPFTSIYLNPALPQEAFMLKFEDEVEDRL